MKSFGLKLLGLFGCIVMLHACTSSDMYLYEDFEFEERVWTADDTKSIPFEIQDTIQRRDFYIHLRNDQAYPYSNLFLFVKLNFPNGKMRIDTLECPLAGTKGQWLGKSFGNLVDHRIRYLSDVVFPLEGDYRIEITQAMRDDTLRGVHNVGFSIE